MSGDMGSTLSGKQRQRISVASALYRRSGILLQDEAICDLDINNEKITRSINPLYSVRLIIHWISYCSHLSSEE